MRKLLIFFLLIGLSIIFVRCGTTQITTDQNIPAQIYINGQLKGTKTATTQRMGLPKKIEITAQYNGAEIGHLSIRRQFTGVTFLVGYLTTFGYFTAWQYPKEIVIPTIENDYDAWAMPQESIWAKPVKKSP